MYRSGGEGRDDGATFVPINEDEVFEVTRIIVDGLEDDSAK